MAERIATSLGAIRETLLIPLYGRATLTRQGSRLIDDPAAVERIDYELSRFDGTMSLIMVECSTFLDAHVEVLGLLPPDLRAMLPSLADDPQMNACRYQLLTLTASS